MKKLQQLKDEAKNCAEPVLYNLEEKLKTKEQALESISSIIDSIITKTYEAGMKEVLNEIRVPASIKYNPNFIFKERWRDSYQNGWNELRFYFKHKIFELKNKLDETKHND